MAAITFSSVCKAFRDHAKNDNMSPISRRLLRLVTDVDSVRNENGEKYKFQSKELIELFKGELDIYPNIREAANDYRIQEVVDFNFVDACEALISEDSFDSVSDELMRLVDADDSMPAAVKSEILNKAYEGLLTIGPKIFLYSLRNNNNTVIKKKKAKKPATTESILGTLKKILAEFPRPVLIEVPSGIKDSEMVYVSAILEAFAEDAGVNVILQNELVSKSEYAKYKRKFDRYRADYFRAESIKESLKDTDLENELGLFAKLQSETYDSIIDKVEDDYETSYRRMNSVLEHVTQVQLSSILAKVPDLVGSSEKKGMCHILVNEERIKWKP